MKKYGIILLLFIIIAALIIIVFNKNKVDNVNIEGRIVVKIENIEYNGYQSTYKKKDNGYIVYSSGEVVKYDNIENRNSIIKTLEKDIINTILDLSNKIDESKISTINTLQSVNEGQIITIYNNKKNVLIKDFYSTNYSNEANEIIKILKEENII